MYEIEVAERRKLFPVYSTPDKVTFRGDIVFDERTFKWAFASHLFDAREISWEPL